MLGLRAALAGGLLVVATAAGQVAPLPPATPADITASAPKSPTTARVLGVIFPGLGHIYAGEVEHGLFYAGAIPSLILVGVIVGAADCATEKLASRSSECGRSRAETLSFIFAGGLWAWSIFDAGRAVRRTNARRAGRASLIVEPTRIPGTLGDDRIAVRLGVRITTW